MSVRAIVLVVVAASAAGGCVRGMSRSVPSPDLQARDGGARLDGLVGDPSRWIVVPRGTFAMGSPATEPCRTDIEDLHEVTLTRSFEMQSTEVTQAQFKELMGGNPSVLATCGPTCPVENVSWHEAAAYCNALSKSRGLAGCYSCTGSGTAVVCDESEAYHGAAFYACPGFRLPTEAEWERAYRAGTTSAVYNGAIDANRCDGCDAADANADRIAWYCWNSGWATHPVGLKQPNAWGLHDLGGNVREWVNDRLVAQLGAAAATDPWGAAVATTRIIRGAAHSDPSTLVRGAYRINRAPGERHSLYGFRCVRTLP